MYYKILLINHIQYKYIKINSMINMKVVFGSAVCENMFGETGAQNDNNTKAHIQTFLRSHSMSLRNGLT